LNPVGKFIPEYKEKVKQIWVVKKSGENMLSKISKNLQRCQRLILQWVKKQTRATEELIEAKTKELEALQQVEDDTTLEAERVLKDEIHALLEQDDLKWRQRAKEAWLKNRNRNTKFFYACAKQRARRNMVSKLWIYMGRSVWHRRR
jgi:aspartyl/asparaginyl-tRNA synthetase